MNRFLIIGGRLAIICAAAAVILGVVDAFTAPVIEARKAAELKAALSSLVSSGEIGEAEAVTDSDTVNQRYPVTGASGEAEALILEMTGSGYGGDMKLVASYGLDGELMSAVLMNNAETPGLGKKAEEPGYMDKFKGRGAETPIPVRKDQLEAEAADAVTGSTITFIGVAKTLARGSDYVKALKAGPSGGDQ